MDCAPGLTICLTVMSTVDLKQQRPRVLVLASYYLPGYRSGGPVRSLSNLIEALGDEFEFHVLSRDRDLNESIPYDEAVEAGRVRIGKGQVRYLKPSFLVPWKIKREVDRFSPDLLYFNSFFDPLFTVLPLWLIRARLIRQVPVLIAPRGEFSSGALGLKTLKKRIYLAVSNLMGVFEGLRWHATGEPERNDITRMMGRRINSMFIAPNLGRSVASDDAPRQPRESGVLSVAFLSRISPMKNLVQAIRIVRRCKVPLRLDIYGPIGDQSYWRQCQEAMADPPPHITIAYQGSIENEKVPGVLKQYDTFLLPSKGENFGHAIVEALTAGLPVVISDRTPWRDLTKAGVGYDLPLSDERAFCDALEVLAARTPDQISRTREAVLAYADRIHSTSDGASRTRSMLMSAINEGRHALVGDRG